MKKEYRYNDVQMTGIAVTCILYYFYPLILMGLCVAFHSSWIFPIAVMWCWGLFFRKVEKFDEGVGIKEENQYKDE